MSKSLKIRQLKKAYRGVKLLGTEKRKKMSIHIGARKGEIAKNILLPGDPLRAKYIAETYLENPRCYNQVRGMLGFTGSYKGVPISVQGTGMGLPSIGIYVNELIREHDVERLIRVGTCGSYQEKAKVRDVILVSSASTNSSANKRVFKGMDFAPCADFKLLYTAYNISQKICPQNTHVGNILASDTFYNHDPEEWKLWASYGVLGVEMESSMLYTLAKEFQRQALTILTVSDSLVTGEETSSQEREQSFKLSMELALETVLQSSH